MHEWALAEAIIDYVKKLIAESNAKAVRRLVIGLGALQAIDKEVLIFSLKELARINNVTIDDIEIIDKEAVFRCRVCKREWRLEDLELDEDVREAIHFIPEAVYAYVKCPRCGSRDFDIVSGRGVKIESIEFR